MKEPLKWLERVSGWSLEVFGRGVPRHPYSWAWLMLIFESAAAPSQVNMMPSVFTELSSSEQLV